MNFANQRLAGCTSRSNMDPSRGRTFPYSSMSSPTMKPDYSNGNRGGCASNAGPYSTMSSPNNNVAIRQPPRQFCGRPMTQNSQTCRQGGSAQMRSRVMSQYEGANQQAQRTSGNCPAAPNPYVPRPDAPIMVNISAATLASARNTSTIADRGEACFEGNPNVKYIPMNWEDILGKTGMNGMKVSMVPSQEPGNPNRQLKISFGNGGTGSKQINDKSAGETPLRVVSFQPVGSQPQSSPVSPMNFSMTGQQGSQNGGQQRGRSCSCPSCRGR